MPRKPFASALLLTGFLLSLPAPPSAENGRRFRMYRNPPKPRLAVLPVAGRMEPPVKEQFDRAMAAEALKLKNYRIASLPRDMVPDSLGRLAPGALASLNQDHLIDFLLRSRLEAAPDRKVLHAEIIDTRNGGVRARFREECRCPAEELISWMVPKSVLRLTGAPNLKGLRCKEGMAVIPAQAGTGSPEPDTAVTSRGPGAFCMDLFEYPNQDAGEPVVGKAWSEAAALCADAGKRLCTEAEWELACGGWKGSAYPYGEAYDPGGCNTQSMTIELSGGNPGCRSPFGVYDLSGNVYEWTSSTWSPKYPDKVVKGGNWNSGAENSACRARFGQKASASAKAIGFRCCMTLTR